jgi:hypothetical protein
MSKSPSAVLDASTKPRVKRRNAKLTGNLSKRAKIKIFGNTKRARLARKKAARA